MTDAHEPAERTRSTPPAAAVDARDSRRDLPRRPMRIQHVMVACITAMIVGSLLNAPGILKTAKGQKVGFKRDVAVAFATPLADVSHFLHTDRARAGLQDLLGRSGDDDINESSPSPTTTAPGPTATTLPRPKYSSTKPMHLWVGGDSLGETPGTSLVNALNGNPSVQTIGEVDTHISTGLARPEVFNWPAHLVDVANTDHPDVMVVSLGSNDNQTMTGDGGGAEFGSVGWKTEYARRVGGLMDAVAVDGRTLIWTGVPIVRQDDKLESYQLINQIIRDQAALRPGRVVYVDTYDLLKGPDGAYAEYLPDAGGALVQARSPDGTHYTRFGGDRSARAVVAAMHGAVDFDGAPAPPATSKAATPTTAKRGK
ncbi:MAG: DUF459 domain-containing protein [Acidimicrobiia bacterium]